jgi:hypothetical protein
MGTERIENRVYSMGWPSYDGMPVGRHTRNFKHLGSS